VWIGILQMGKMRKTPVERVTMIETWRPKREVDIQERGELMAKV
jgi:hypothetical protein